jgi:hypothetical protein
LAEQEQAVKGPDPRIDSYPQSGYKNPQLGYVGPAGPPDLCFIKKMKDQEYEK